MSNTMGSGNTVIGNLSDVAFGNLNNATAIGNGAASMPAIRSAWETLLSR